MSPIVQGSLFAAPAGARASDPLSSHAAADELERSGRGKKQAELVLALLKRTPGLTSGELAARHQVDRYLVARRLPDLERAGLVRRIEYGARAVRWEPITSTSGGV